MPKMLLIDELYLTIKAPAGLPKASYQAILRALRYKRFHAGLHNAMREVLGRYPSLTNVKLEIHR